MMKYILIFIMLTANMYSDIESYYGINIEGDQYQILDTEIILGKMSEIPISAPNGESWDLLYLFKRMGVNKITFSDWNPDGSCEAYVDKGSRTIHLESYNFKINKQKYYGYKYLIPLLFHEAAHVMDNLYQKNLNDDDRELHSRNVEREIKLIVNNY